MTANEYISTWINPPVSGQAKHTFRTGAVWNAHLECMMALRDPEYQKRNKLGFWTMALTIFLAQALIFSGWQAPRFTALFLVLGAFNPSDLGRIKSDLWLWSHKHIPKVDSLYNTSGKVKSFLQPPKMQNRS